MKLLYFILIIILIILYTSCKCTDSFMTIKIIKNEKRHIKLDCFFVHRISCLIIVCIFYSTLDTSESNFKTLFMLFETNKTNHYICVK